MYLSFERSGGEDVYVTDKGEQIWSKRRLPKYSFFIDFFLIFRPCDFSTFYFVFSGSIFKFNLEPGSSGLRMDRPSLPVLQGGFCKMSNLEGQKQVFMSKTQFSGQKARFFGQKPNF